VGAEHPYGATYGFVVSSNPGSRVAWFEFPRPGAPDLVVYDTSTGEETSRQAIDVPTGSGALLASVTERYGYWFVDPDFEDWEPQARVDLATGVQEPVGAKEYYADAPPVGTPRTMMVSTAQGNEPVVYLVHDAVGWQFDVGGGRLEPQGPQPLDARDGGTGQPFAFAAPAEYPNAAPNWLSQWLDDDTVVVTVTRGGHDDLFECHFSTRGCTVALRVPAEAVMPGIG
jgi:hypothetical protein